MRTRKPGEVPSVPAPVSDTLFLIINKHTVPVKPKNVAGIILSMFVPHVEYMSVDAMCALFENIAEFMYDIGVKGRDKTKAAYFLRIADIARKRYTNAENEEIQQGVHRQLMYTIINTVLGSEGMSTLPGFGFAKFDSVEGRRKVTGHYMINPEKTSIKSIKY